MHAAETSGTRRTRRPGRERRAPVPPCARRVALALATVALLVACAKKDPNDGKDTRYNEETVAIMRRVMAPDANGVDVGAFEGALTRPMVEIAPRGRHIAVEPQPSYAATLREEFPQVRVLELALGENPGTADFIEALDSPARSGLKKQEYPTAHERTKTISVRVARLDDLVSADTPIAFIKIDVEGAEYMVLRGAVKTIRRDRPVIAFEYGRAGRQDYGTEPAMMWRLLHDELGLEVSLMRTWLDHGPPFTAEGFRQMVDSGKEWMFIAYPPPGSPRGAVAPRQ